MKKKKFLFAFDLDGTVLANSDTGEMHPITQQAIERVKKEGHIVIIITGRPWGSTKKIYNKLKLDTLVGNYNGAYIHNPSNEFFIPSFSYVNLNEMLYIINDEKVKSYIENVAFEGPGWVQLEKRDATLEKIFGFDSSYKFRIGMDVGKLPLRPTGVIFDTKIGVDHVSLKRYLDRRFGDLGEFSFWSKGTGLSPVFDITAVGVSKQKVISLASRYYNVDTSNILSFGDGINDISMLKMTNISVAMENSIKLVKKEAKFVTKYSNKEGGVGHFVNKFLNDPEKYLEEAKKLRGEGNSIW